jgi:hypothetical protein
MVRCDKRQIQSAEARKKLRQSEFGDEFILRKALGIDRSETGETASADELYHSAFISLLNRCINNGALRSELVRLEGEGSWKTVYG